MNLIMLTGNKKRVSKPSTIGRIGLCLGEMDGAVN